MEFSDIAIQKLLQSFPELSAFIASFKDVTEDLNREEDDIKVGIFILLVGKTPYYIPVIAKGGIVQPMDSIFSLEDQMFIPLTKSWAEKISTSSTLVGRSTKIPTTVSRNPSVYEMVVPPRTGKYTYAGSKLPEFLSVTSPLTKQALLDTISSDVEFAEGLHKLFDIKDIVKALKYKEPTGTSKVPNPNADQVQILTGIEGENLSESEIQEVLNKGYAMRGVQKETRVAVPALEYNQSGLFRQLSQVDQGQDYEIAFRNGETRQGTYLKRSKSIPQIAALLDKNPADNFVLFNNGDYATSRNIVSVGEGTDGNKVFKSLFEYSPPIVASQVSNGSTILVLSPELEYVTTLRVRKVEINSNGTTLKGSSLLTGDNLVIHAFVNCPRINVFDRKEYFVPANCCIVNLGSNLNSDLEVNINSAVAKRELTTMLTLGGLSTVGFDGVEYSYNGKPVGTVPKIIEVLVVKEGITPTQAENFVKQAQVLKTCKFYLSKKADFTPGEIPQYGEIPNSQPDQQGLSGAFVPTVKESLSVNDPQTSEATIISELLQAPNMGEYIDEYLPDIKAGMDKLGRVLFLARINMSKMFNGENASEIFSMIGSLRNVYKQLGDNCLKIEKLRSLNVGNGNTTEQPTPSN